MLDVDSREMIERFESLRQMRPLRSLFFEITDGCNLKCLHCGSSCTPEHASFLPVELILETLDSIEKNKAQKPFICLTGGEPLLHPHFFEIGEILASRGYRWGITTNGTMIDECAAKRMVAAKMTSVSFSLDGLHDSHNRLRANPAAFSLALKGIASAMKYFKTTVSTMITSVIYRDNIDELDQIYRMAEVIGVDYWRPINIEPIGRANANADLFLQKEEYEKLFDFIKQKRLEGRKPIAVFGCSHALPDRYERSVREDFFFCYSGITNASILVNGDIFGCLDIERRKELVQGNVKGDDFYKVWREKFGVFRSDRSECDFCRSCNDRVFCRGDSAHTWDYDRNRPLLCLRQMLN